MIADVNGDDVIEAVEAMRQTLSPLCEQDWSVRAGDLEWSCWTTAAHVAHDLTAYAGQLAGRATRGYLPFDLVARDGASPAELLQIVAACGAILATIVNAASKDARAWHWGPTDPSGFAALGVNETLVHTWDITQGLGAPWRPPEPLAAQVVGRLFPDAPGGSPAEVLLWCTGRAALGDLPRRVEWRMRAAVE